jgi:hypothetical protein
MSGNQMKWRRHPCPTRSSSPWVRCPIGCRSGGRSGKAAEFLLANGFDDVTNLVGGMMSLGLQD